MGHWAYLAAGLMHDASGDGDGRNLSSGSSLAGRGGFRARRRIFWLAPLGLLLVAALGYWAYDSVERSQKQQRSDELRALLRASAEGLSSWLAAQEAQAAAVAAHASVVDAVAALHAVGGGPLRPNWLSEHAAQQRLREQLSLLLSGTNYEQFRLAEPDGSVLASSNPGDIGQPAARVATHDPDWAKARDVRVWMPYGSRSGAIRMGVSAPILLDGRHLATLFLVFDPAREFYAIMSAARSGSTGETYAFNRAGRLLSPSRFDEGLRVAGQLGPEAPSAVLQLELREPSLTSAEPKPAGAASPRPFTLGVRRALAERKAGFDVDGYLDYRGTPVIGAWTWLSGYELGLITEKDASEAFALRDTVRRAIGLLLLALVLVMAGLVALTHVATLLQRRSRKAERRLEQLGQYKLTQKLGEGGMGAVYSGQHVMLRRPTAIKLLKHDGDGDAARARFEREVRITSQLTHPNTIAIYDYGVTPDGTFYYAMELLDGMDLEALVRQGGPLPPARVIHLLLQACGSLTEAHAAGLIHRDVKPANLIVCSRGGVWDTLKVLDFGLVKDTRRAGSTQAAPASIIGTPAFIAPEVLKDAELASPATDVYALGATAYFLLTGHYVFDEHDAMRFLVAHLTEEPRRPSAHVREVPADLEAVIMRCLEKEPQDRYPDMEALAHALQQCAEHGRWTSRHAQAFWQGRGAALRRSQPPASGSAGPLSVGVDLRELRRRGVG